MADQGCTNAQPTCMVSVGRICWLALGICRTALSRTFAFHNFAMWACIGVWGHEVGSALMRNSRGVVPGIVAAFYYYYWCCGCSCVENAHLLTCWNFKTSRENAPCYRMAWPTRAASTHWNSLNMQVMKAMVSRHLAGKTTTC